MKKLEMVYDLRDWPDGNIGHLQPTDEVVNAFKNISKNSSHKIENILEFGFNTGVSSYIILETLPKTKITSIEISKYLNAEEGVSRLKKNFMIDIKLYGVTLN
jgi:predicted O-methyltransferase YrrM